MQSGHKEMMELVKKYKLPLCNSAFLKAKTDIGSLRLNYPLAAKIVSSDIIHKTDAGLVRTNIQNKEECSQVFDEFTLKARKLKAKVEGVLVQETQKGLELFVGAKQDAQFGAIVMFGLGGIFLEIFKDISIRIVPLTKEDALQMIYDIKAARIFQDDSPNTQEREKGSKQTKGVQGAKGARGQRYAIDDLAELLLKVSKIMATEHAIKELDLNPVFLSESGVKLVDIRIIKAK